MLNWCDLNMNLNFQNSPTPGISEIVAKTFFMSLIKDDTDSRDSSSL